MLNKDWGHIYDYGFNGNVAVATWSASTTGKYVYSFRSGSEFQRQAAALSIPTDADGQTNGISQWSVQVGFKVRVQAIHAACVKAQASRRPGQPGHAFFCANAARIWAKVGGLLRRHDPDAAASGPLERRLPLPTVNTHLYPKGGLDVLSREGSRAPARCLRRHATCCAAAPRGAHQRQRLRRPARRAELYPRLRHPGPAQQDRGVRIELRNAPAMAFVDGHIIRGVAELLFAVVRDLAYTAIELGPEFAAELETSSGITDAVFRLLRNARVLQPGRSQPGGLLGRPFDRARRVRLHQAGRLRAGLRGLTSARAVARRDEGR